MVNSRNFSTNQQGLAEEPQPIGSGSSTAVTNHRLRRRSPETAVLEPRLVFLRNSESGSPRNLGSKVASAFWGDRGPESIASGSSTLSSSSRERYIVHPDILQESAFPNRPLVQSGASALEKGAGQIGQDPRQWMPPPASSTWLAPRCQTFLLRTAQGNPAARRVGGGAAWSAVPQPHGPMANETTASTTATTCES